MTTKEFIIESMLEISKHINGINLKYAYDEISDYNIIEVFPESIRRGNKEYMELEADFWREFYEKFPSEKILISSVDEFNNMNNLIFSSEKSEVERLKSEVYNIHVNSNNTYMDIENYSLAA